MDRVWIFGDYKQAESRVVAWRGPVPQMKQWFLEGRDIHIEIAKSIGQIIQEHKLNLPNNLFKNTHYSLLTALDKEERQVGKTTGHAGNYDIGKNTLAVFLGMDPRYAEIILTIYHAKFPGIKNGYQRWIADQLRHNNRTIKLPVGWEKTFYDIMSDKLLRAGYAFYPQSIVGYLLTQTIVKLGEHFESINFNEGTIWTPKRIGNCGFDIRLNSHDAVGVSVPDSSDLISFTISKIKEYAEVPLNIEGEELIIPMDFKIGKNWGELKDYEA